MLSLLYLAVTPWIPLGVLTGAALFLLSLRVRRLPRVVQATVILTTTVVWGWLLALGASPIPMVHTVSLTGPLDMSITLLLRLDGGHWPFAFIAASVALAGALLLPTRPPVGRVSGPSTGLLFLAGVLITTMAGNLLTLLLGWVVTNVAYLGLLLSGGSRALWRTVGLVLMAGLILWSVVGVLPPYMSVLPWADVVFPAWALGLMGASVWLYLGAYPLHRQHLLAVPGVPAPWLWLDVVAGGAWLWRWATLDNAYIVWSHPTWLALAIFAGFGSALAAWISSAPRSRIVWAQIQRASILLFLPYLGAQSFHDATVLLVAAVVLAGGALLTLQRHPLPRGHEPAHLLTLALFWGLPWTVGAPEHMVMARLWAMHPLLGGLLILADALVLGALLIPTEMPRPADRLGIVRVAAFLLPALVLGGWLRHASALPWLIWLGTAGPALLIGGFLAWQRPRIFLELRNWTWGMQAMAYLDPLEGLARRVASWVLVGIGGLVTLVDGVAWVGWIALAALLAAVWPYLPGGR